MNKNNEMVLTTTRKHLVAHGAFQGYRHGTDLLNEILESGNWQFRRRGDVEDDPCFKQIIPYCIILQEGKVLVYERGKSGGEAKLHAKLSLGIGGHINPEDARLTGTEQVHRALLRELEEELVLPDPTHLRFAGLINDESDPVGQVHFGIVAIVEVGPGKILPNESAIHNLKMVEVTKLPELKARLESWSKIVVANLRKILPKTEYFFSVGDYLEGPVGYHARIESYGIKEATQKLAASLPDFVHIPKGKRTRKGVKQITVYFKPSLVAESNCKQILPSKNMITDVSTVYGAGA